MTLNHSQPPVFVHLRGLLKAKGDPGGRELRASELRLINSDRNID